MFIKNILKALMPLTDKPGLSYNTLSIPAAGDRHAFGSRTGRLFFNLSPVFALPFRRRRRFSIRDSFKNPIVMCLVLVVMSSAKVMAAYVITVTNPVSMTTTYGTASANQTFNVKGTGLTNNVTIAAPPAGFEISVNGGTTWVTTAATITAAQAGAVGGFNVLIRIRVTSTVTGSPYSGNIVVSSTPAGGVNGTVVVPVSTVTAASITITAKAQTKTYGTTFTFAGTQYTITAGSLKNADAITTVNYACAGSVSTATVAGSPYLITPSGATGTGNFSTTNYTITYGTANMTVTAKALTLVATAQTKVYGTTFTFAGTEFTQVGSVAGDITGVTLTSTGTPATATVIGGPTYPINITPGSAVGPGIANYTFSYTAANLTVTKAALTVNIGSLAVTTRNYDGTNTATLSGSASGLTGVVNSDNVTLAGSPTGTFASANVGAGQVVNLAGYSLSGSTAGNYTLTAPTTTGTITPALLTITATGPLKTYGTALTAGSSTTNFNTSGLVHGETVTNVYFTPDAAGLDNPTVTPVGNNYVVTPSLPVTGGGGSGTTFASGNYSITFNTYTGTVTGAILTITCGTLSQVYGTVDVSSIPNLYTVTGLVNGDTQATALTTLPTITCAATNASGVVGSPYAITASGAVANSNYASINYVAGSYTITPAPLTIYATGPAKSYGVPITTGTYTAFFSATGLVNGESVTSLTLTPNNAGMDVPSNTAVGGAYSVMPSNVAGFTTSNYTISYVAYSGVCGNSYTWTGANGATNTNWNNSANWTSSTGGTFPGANDNATIPGGLAYYPTVNVASQCNTLTFSSGSSTILINAGLTLIVNQGLTVPAGVIAQITNASTTSVLQIGTTTSGSLITNSGYFHLTGGKLSIPSGANYISNSSSGTVQLDGGITFNITGYGYTANNAIVNAGFFYAGVSGSPCYLEFDDSQSILNQNTGSFYLGPTSRMYYFNTSAHDCHVVNSPGGVFTLQSDVTGSASILAIPQNASNPNTYVGTFTVERYVTGNRAYRLLSSPVYAGTISSNKVYDISYVKLSSYLSGTTGAAGGFDKTGNPTLYLYRENNVPLYTTFLNSNFRGVNNISSTPTYGMDDASYASANLPIGSGFLFFYRGNRNSGLYTQAQEFTVGTPAESVVLSTKGNLNMGNVVVHDWYTPGSANLGYTTVSGSVNVEGFNLVGNPYPCSIDWDQSTSGGITTTAVAPFSWQLIPSGLQGAGNYNVYQAGTNIGGNKQGTQGTANSNIIASGEGFFVQATSSSAALTFKETAKSSTLNTGANLYMGTHLVTNNTPYMRLKLALDSINSDGAIIRFNDNSKAAFDVNEDAIYKTGSGAVSLSSLSSDNMLLAINQQPFIIRGQTIPINVNASANGTYKLNMAEIKGIPQLFSVWLKDNFLKDSVNMRATNPYSFTITKTDSTTFGSKRFTLLIRQDSAYAYRLLTFDAKKVTDARAVQVAWTTRFEENYTNFTVEKSIDNGKTFNVLGSVSASAMGAYSLTDSHPVNGINLYRLKQVDINNTITYSKIVPVAYSDRTGSLVKNNLNVFPNPATHDISLVVLNDLTNASGYNIMITNSLGFVIKKGTSGQASWQASVSDLLPGTYLVKVYNNKDQALVGSTKFVKL